MLFWIYSIFSWVCRFPYLCRTFNPTEAEFNWAARIQQLKRPSKHFHFTLFNYHSFSLTSVPMAVKRRTYMIYSWLCLFQGASVEYMMEHMIALLLKSIWMIERSWQSGPGRLCLVVASEVWAAFIFPEAQERLSICQEWQWAANKKKKQRQADWDATAVTQNHSFSVSQVLTVELHPTFLGGLQIK